MTRLLTLVGCCCFLPLSAFGVDDIIKWDGTSVNHDGGLTFLRRGNQTSLSVGGALFGRKIRVTTDTPEGPVVTRFTLPSPFHTPHNAPWLGTAPATIQVEVPDVHALLSVEGQEITTERALRRTLQSPPLPPGEGQQIRVRAIFTHGDRIVVEDRQIPIRAGGVSIVTFDGSRPIASVAPTIQP